MHYTGKWLESKVNEFTISIHHALLLLSYYNYGPVSNHPCESCIPKTKLHLQLLSYYAYHSSCPVSTTLAQSCLYDRVTGYQRLYSPVLCLFTLLILLEEPVNALIPIPLSLRLSFLLLHLCTRLALQSPTLFM